MPPSTSRRGSPRSSTTMLETELDHQAIPSAARGYGRRPGAATVDPSGTNKRYLRATRRAPRVRGNAGARRFGNRLQAPRQRVH